MASSDHGGQNKTKTWQAKVVLGIGVAIATGSIAELFFHQPGHPMLTAGAGVLGLLAILFGLIRMRHVHEAEHQAFLDERIECRGGCNDPWQPRRTFFQVNRGYPPYLCPICYHRITGIMPYVDPRAKRAFV
jgi:hypothetical protein